MEGRGKEGMQLTLFDGSQRFKIDKPIRLIELFAGIGSQAKALKNIGADFSHYRICEFDKYAVQSYNAVHGTNFETSDITKITADDLGIVDTDKYCYIMTYSFPCQDLSNAGLGKGMAKGSGTRSGLLWEVERLLEECEELPQVLLMENVPAVIGAKNIQHFAQWQEKLESLGYKNTWKILNAKDYGIPQNRERCFMVSMLGDYYYDFPEGKPLELRLKDMLEASVDEKYYLSDSMIKYITANNEKWTGNNGKAVINKSIASTLTTSEGCYRCDTSNYISNDFPENFDLKKEVKLEKVAQLTDKKYNEMSGRVYSEDGLSPTIMTMQRGCCEPKVAVWDGYNQRVRADSEVVGTLTRNCGSDLKRNGQGIIEPIAYDEQNQYLRTDGCVGTLTCDGSSPKHNNRVVEPIKVREATKKEYAEAETGDTINIAYPTSNTRRGRVGKGVAQTLTTQENQVVVSGNYRIRKLTPKECWRLMGLTMPT